MTLKLNIGDEKGNAWRIEIDNSSLAGKSIGDVVKGDEISADLSGYELEIKGGSDSSGFPLSKEVEGEGLKGLLLTKGWGMHKRPRREGKKKVSTPKGVRIRKTVRGRIISDSTVQVNLLVIKKGSKKLEEIFPDQNKASEPEKPAEESKPAESSAEAPIEKKETKLEEKEEVKKEPTIERSSVEVKEAPEEEKAKEPNP